MDVVRPHLTAEATAGLSASVTAAAVTAADFVGDVTSSQAREAILLQDNNKPSNLPSLLQTLPPPAVLAALLHMRMRNPGTTSPNTAAANSNGHAADRSLQVPPAIPLSSIGTNHNNSRVKPESLVTNMETDSPVNDSLASPPALIIPSTEQPSDNNLQPSGSQEQLSIATGQDAVLLPSQPPRSLHLSHKVSPVSETEMDALFGPQAPAPPLSLIVQLEKDGQLQPEVYDQVTLKEALGSYYLSGLPYKSCLGLWHAGWRREPDSADGRPHLVRVLVSKEEHARDMHSRCTRHASTLQSSAPSNGTAAGSAGLPSGPAVAAPATVAAVPAVAAPPRPIASFAMRITSPSAAPDGRAVGASQLLRPMIQQQDAHSMQPASAAGALVDNAGYVMGGPGSLTYPQKRYLDGYKTVSFVRTSELKQLFGPDARTLLPLECTMKVEVDGVLQPGISHVTFKETGANNSVYYIKGFKASLGLNKWHCGFKRDQDGTVVLLLRNLPPGDESHGFGAQDGGGRGRGRGGRGIKRESSGAGRDTGVVSKRGRGGRGRASGRGATEAALMKQLQEEEEDEEERWASASWEDTNVDASQQQQLSQVQPQGDDSGLTVSDVDADEQLDMMVCASAAAAAAAAANPASQNGTEASSGKGISHGVRQGDGGGIQAGWQQQVAAAMGQLSSMLQVAELDIHPPAGGQQGAAAPAATVGQQQQQAALGVGAGRAKLGSLPWMGASEGKGSRPRGPAASQAQAPPPAIQNPWLPSSNRVAAQGGAQASAAGSGAGYRANTGAAQPASRNAPAPAQHRAHQSHGLPHPPPAAAQAQQTSGSPAPAAAAQQVAEPAPTHPAAALLPAYVHAGLVDASSPLPVLLLDQPTGSPPRATDLRCALSGVLQAMRHLGAGQTALLAAYEAFHALQGAQLTTFLHSNYTLLAVAHSSGLREMVMHALGLGLGPRVVQLLQGAAAAPAAGTPLLPSAADGLEPQLLATGALGDAAAAPSMQPGGNSESTGQLQLQAPAQNQAADVHATADGPIQQQVAAMDGVEASQQQPQQPSQMAAEDVEAAEQLQGCQELQCAAAAETTGAGAADPSHATGLQSRDVQAMDSQQDTQQEGMLAQ